MYITAIKMLLPALKENKKLTVLVVGGVLSMIGLDVCFSYWRQAFYNRMQAYDAQGVFFYLGVFCAIAAVYVVIYGVVSYFQRYLEFGVRENLFERFSKTWKQVNVTNPEQRLAEDCILFGQLSINLTKALIVASIKLPVFFYILYSAASWWVASLLFLYAIIGTILSKVVAKKLVELEYVQQRREAEFRKELTYAVDNDSNFPTLYNIKLNWRQLATQNKYLSFFVSGYDQLGVILPYLMLLQLYLSKKVMLGSLFQVAGAAGEVLSSLSVLVNSRDIVVQLTMCTRRLKEMEIDENATL